MLFAVGQQAAARPPAPVSTAAAAHAPQPRLAPADCGHVTPRANREGPEPERGTARPPPAQQTRAGNS